MRAPSLPVLAGTFSFQDNVPYHLHRGAAPVLPFRDLRVIPFAIVCASLVYHGILAVVSLITRKAPEPPRVADKRRVGALGGATIVGFMLARLVGSVSLLALSAETLQNACSASESYATCPELFLTGTFLYASIIGLVALFRTSKWAVSATRFNIVALFAAFAVYAYRDLWPLATFAQHPADRDEGSVLFVKIGILAVIAVLVPLLIPRRYVPVDPEDPMLIPNPEQTASILSILTFSFVDEVIYMGWKAPHLAADMLPPLADYDTAKYQTEKNFPHMDAFSGASQRHFFWKMLRVFWKEYLAQAISVVLFCVGDFASPIGIYYVLRYLETGGADQPVKPWLWIIWLFCGPILKSSAQEFYLFCSARIVALTEVLVTQLVFEHGLRIRFVAETSNASAPAESGTGTPPGGDDVSVDIGDTAAQGSGSDTDSSETAPLAASEVSENTPVDPTAPTKGSDDPKPKEVDSGEGRKNIMGKINNLVTSDLNNITGASDFWFLVMGVPLNIFLCIFILYRMLGWSTFVGLAVMIATIPLPGLISNKIHNAAVERSKVTDARVQAVTEAISVIRMIKLFGWEARTSKRLTEGKREEELRLTLKIKALNLVYLIIGFWIPTFVKLTIYGLYTMVMKKSLTPSIIFSSLAVLDTLSNQLTQVMYSTVRLIQVKVSLDRLTEFLRKSELLDSFMDKGATPSPGNATANSAFGSRNEIGFKNASFAWSREEGKDGDSRSAPAAKRVFRLRVDGSLFFKRNAINMIVGPTGAGKTSILMALLGEMHFIPLGNDSWFNLPRDGGIAYASQESWVENDTIRNNILFGSEYDETRYKAVIMQCALESDLALFEAGDDTEVGERGLTLSGGQKARVTLARAIYSPAEIVLLDDVLAALDVHTASWVVDKCFRGDLVKNRTILLVTHNVALVTPVADFIVSIGTNGKIKSQGNDLKVAASRDLELAKEIESDKVATELGDEVIDDPMKKQAADGAGKLTVAEEIVEGRVSWDTFGIFMKSMGGKHPFVFYAAIVIALQLDMWSSNFQAWYLGFWGSQYETHPASEVPVVLFMTGYAGTTFLFCILFSVSYVLSMYGSIRASRTINKMLVDSILGSTLRWLDETPVGRIVARCTRDIRSVDNNLPSQMLSFVENVTQVMATLGAILIFTPLFVWPALLVGLIGLWLGNMYLKAQLSIKRETSNAQGPVLSHFSAAIHGIVSIRAYGAQDRVKRESHARINKYTRVARTSYNVNRWISVRTDILAACFTAGLASYLVYGPRVSTANTGFSLNLTLHFANALLFLVRSFNSLEVESNSLERIKGFIEIEHEPKPTEEGKPPAYWPASGDLRVERLSARYSRDGPEVLHELSFHIASGERVGVVGRTGSGKSSLTLSILRLIPTEGEVYIDGLPVKSINLDALRGSITIIPQTPELLSGTLRENLDPFEQNDDASLNSALEAAGLFALQEESGDAKISLDTKVASGGGNLSVGQRQIIALARAMIRGSKLLILDEATSAIDYTTDAIIQQTLRTKLAKDVTVITIAHRLQTIMDYDKIMVLADGRIVEFGKPDDLLRREDGALRALVNDSSDKEKLQELAQRS